MCVGNAAKAPTTIVGIALYVAPAGGNGYGNDVMVVIVIGANTCFVIEDSVLFASRASCLHFLGLLFNPSKIYCASGTLNPNIPSLEKR